jgi:hypothetical protein
MRHIPTFGFGCWYSTFVWRGAVFNFQRVSERASEKGAATRRRGAALPRVVRTHMASLLKVCLIDRGEQPKKKKRERVRVRKQIQPYFIGSISTAPKEGPPQCGVFFFPARVRVESEINDLKWVMPGSRGQY